MKLRTRGLVARGKSNKNPGARLSLHGHEIEKCAALRGTDDPVQFVG
ncbi:hypothetical protein [Novosphingobium sp. BL-52-GroH]